MNVFIAAVGLFAGAIIEFSGAIADIPTGWVLCNGDNDTPDLRDRFVVGAGSTFAVDAMGGSTSHTHTVNQSGHTHDIEDGGDISSGTDYDILVTSTDPAITCDTRNHLPKYLALAYIMKT